MEYAVDELLVYIPEHDLYSAYYETKIKVP